MDAPHVLVVDDEEAAGSIMAALLRQAGFSASSVTSGDAALRSLERDVVDVVVSDLLMPKMDGLELLATMRREHPRVPFIMVTAHASIRTAVEAIQRGATDYLEKPVERDDLIRVVHKALAVGARPPGTLSPSTVFGDVQERAAMGAPSNAPVLILGETGTGKTHLARFIHQQSNRRDGPFIELDCGALQGNLIESELFGHVKGAFTGATTGRLGAARQADKGTLFLDEIGDLDPHLQVKLLRLIQEQEVRPVGADHTIKVDLRIITATKRDLRSLVQQEKFRDDLFYRAAVIELELQPLRKRPTVLRELAEEVCAKIGAEPYGRRVYFDEAAYAVLQSHTWPGNIRELENIVRRLMIYGPSDRITAEQVAEELSPQDEPRDEPSPLLGLAGQVRATEERAISEALKRTTGNKTEAAKLLGISRRTLYNKMRELGIEDDHSADR